jgi:hypothetical protein
MNEIRGQNKNSKYLTCQKEKKEKKEKNKKKKKKNIE